MSVCQSVWVLYIGFVFVLFFLTIYSFVRSLNICLTLGEWRSHVHVFHLMGCLIQNMLLFFGSDLIKKDFGIFPLRCSKICMHLWIESFIL